MKEILKNMSKWLISMKNKNCKVRTKSKGNSKEPDKN